MVFSLQYLRDKRQRNFNTKYVQVLRSSKSEEKEDETLRQGSSIGITSLLISATFYEARKNADNQSTFPPAHILLRLTGMQMVDEKLQPPLF